MNTEVFSQVLWNAVKLKLILASIGFAFLIIIALTCVYDARYEKKPWQAFPWGIVIIGTAFMLWFALPTISNVYKDTKEESYICVHCELALAYSFDEEGYAPKNTVYVHTSEGETLLLNIPGRPNRPWIDRGRFPPGKGEAIIWYGKNSGYLLSIEWLGNDK